MVNCATGEGVGGGMGDTACGHPHAHCKAPEGY